MASPHALYSCTSVTLIIPQYFIVFYFAGCTFRQMKVNQFFITINLICILFFSLKKIAAQESITPHIDPSRPTNLYTRLSNNLEYNFLKNGNRTYGYRGNFIWASRNQKQAAQIEFPLLYSTSSGKFGVGDIRLRYNWIPYKDYSKKPGALNFTLDTYLPTGNRDNGLGRGRWIIAPGISTAFVFGNFSIFPTLSYVHSSEIIRGKKPVDNTALTGYMIQTSFVYKINKKNYIDCTPFFIKNSYSNAGKDDFIAEGNYLYMLKANKIQIGCFARRYFYGNTTTIRASLRYYF